MLSEFKKHITLNFPFLLESKLLIAISGGIDSIVLTHLCYKTGLNIALAHCNFNLRGKESNEDEQFIVDLANSLDMEVFVQSFDTKTYVEENNLSVQVAARELRYDWFNELSEALEYNYILTAHQADDNLETFLINLSRGTGIEGLTGIPPINQKIIRPLLPFSRENIINYANENKLKWRDDSSNNETKYLRNKLRHQVIPKLKEINPVLLSNFQTTINHLKGTSEILDKHINQLKSELFIYEGDVIKISVNQLQKLNPQKDYLYEIFKDFGFTEWNDVQSLLTSSSGKQILSSTYRLIKHHEYLLISKHYDNTENDIFTIEKDEQCVLNPIPLSFTDVDHISEVNNQTIYIDKKKLNFPLIVRKRKEGDYFYPFGMKGKKKLSKFFKDEKYSLLDKENQWLLCSNDQIVWVIGKRADNRFKITEATSESIKIKAY